MTKRTPNHATLMLLAAALFWGGGGLIVKATPLAGPQLAFWRSLAGALIYQSVLLAQKKKPSIKGFRTALVGGVGFGLSLVLQFIAYKSTTLVSANVIGSIQPLLLAVFLFVSVRITKARRKSAVESHGLSAISATFLAVAGTVVVIIGSTSGGAWSIHGDVAAFASVIIGCLYPIGIKHARPTMGSLEFQAASLWISTIITLPAAAFTAGSLSFPPWRALLWILGLVAIGGSGHLLFTSAQRHVSVVASSTIALLEVAAVAIGANVFFHQSVTALQLLGMAIVALAIGWWVAQSNRSRAKE